MELIWNEQKFQTYVLYSIHPASQKDIFFRRSVSMHCVQTYHLSRDRICHSLYHSSFARKLLYSQIQSLCHVADEMACLYIVSMTRSHLNFLELGSEQSENL